MPYRFKPGNRAKSSNKETDKSNSAASSNVTEDVEQQAATSDQSAEDEEDPGGYPRLCSYMESDSDLFQFRRFGELGVRNLLYMQDELAVLERELTERDLNPETDNGCCREDKDKRRAEIMKKVRVLIQDYTQALETQLRLRALARPTPGQRLSLVRWVENVRPLAGDEDSFVEDQFRGDLVCPAAEKGRLHRAVDKTDWMKRLFRTEVPVTLKAPDKSLVYYSETHVKRVERAFVILVGIVFLIAPLLALSRWSGKFPQVYIITTMVTLFAAFIGALTKLGNGEVLASSAAYAAVLVVFLGSPSIGGT